MARIASVKLRSSLFPHVGSLWTNGSNKIYMLVCIPPNKPGYEVEECSYALCDLSTGKIENIGGWPQDPVRELIQLNGSITLDSHEREEWMEEFEGEGD